MPHMPLINSAFIGLVEGLTEFLPISSTAHMEVVPQLVGMEDPGPAFSAVVQMGAGVSIIAYFFKDLMRYVAAIFRTKSPSNIAPDDLDGRLGWFALLACIPVIVFGLLLHKYIETNFRSLYVIASSLILMGLVLLYAEKVGKQTIPLEKLTLKDAMVIGFAQCLALVPGTSRSGITITSGLFRGVDRGSVTRFSFLISVIPIMGAGIYELFKELKHNKAAFMTDIGAYAIGTVIAMVSAYMVIHWFLGYMRKHSTVGFVIYRVALGLLLFGLLKTGKLHNMAPKEKAASSVTTSIHLASAKP